MRKKLLATVLAASMVLAMAPVLPANTSTVASAEETTTPEELVGNGWWNAENVNSSHVNLAGDGSVTLYVGCTKALNGFSTFCIELNKDANYITSTSRADIWGIEGATFEGKDPDTKAVEEGHLYKITVTRAGDDFTIVYYDVTADKEFHTFKAIGAAMGDSVDVYVIPQEGNMLVSTSEFTMPDVTPSEPAAPSKKKMTVKVTAKKNAKTVTGTVSAKKATVKVKVGKKAYKKATVSGKKFTFKCAKLTKGTKVTVKVTKSGYKAVTKTVTVK